MSCLSYLLKAFNQVSVLLYVEYNRIFITELYMLHLELYYKLQID